MPGAFYAGLGAGAVVIVFTGYMLCRDWEDGERSKSVVSETSRGPLAAAGRIAQLLITEDLQALQLRFRIVSLLIRLMPSLMFGWLRPSLYRLAGVHFGPRCRVLGPIDITGAGPIAANVRVGSGCFLTTPLFLNASAPITIGDNVSIGHHAVIITDSHEYDDPSHRCGPRTARPVTIGRGAWIAACVTILSGVTIGEGSVVGAGSVVTRDVPRNTLVLGVPARIVKKI